MPNNHSDFYSKAKYYDIAFGFKKVSEENQTLLELFRSHVEREARSFLDIGAGPASNAIEMGKRRLNAFALDYSAEMVTYGREKAKQAGVTIRYSLGDMRNFRLEEPVDLAAIFMDSTSYLVTNDDVILHLRAVAANLNPNGIYVMEMSHPRDVFNVGKSASTEWTEKSGDIEVSIRWGDEDDPFDPIRQVTRVTAKLRYKTPTETGEITDVSDQRCFTFNEIEGLIRAEGSFKLVDVIGSLTPRVPFSNEKSCWRMIPVLQRV